MSTRAAVLLLAGAMAAVFAGALAYVGELSNFFVQPDELTYIRAAMTWGEEGRPVLPSDPWFSSYAQLMPALVAPVYALSGDGASAFDRAHVVLALAFVSAAIPMFLLMRRLAAPPAAALLVAVLSIVVPWLALAGGMLTEPVAYPAFCWALLAMLVALERRDWRGDVIGLAGIALAFVARTQFVVLGPALLAAVLLHDVALRRRPADIARSHAVLLGVTVLGAVALLVDPDRFLGSYAAVRDSGLLTTKSLTAARDLLAGVTVGVGVLPLALALAWIALALVRPASPRLHAFAALATVTGITLTLTIGAYTVTQSPAPHDRYLMYLAPVLAACTVLLLVDRRRALWPLALGGAVTALVLRSEYLEQEFTSMIAPAQVFRKVVNGRSDQLGDLVGIDGGVTVVLPVLALLAVGALAVVRWREVRPAAVAGVVGLGLLLVGAGQTAYTLREIAKTQSGVAPEFVAGRGWLDAHIEPGRAAALVGLLYDDVGSTSAGWWETRSFNKAIDWSYRLDPQDHYGQAFSSGLRVARDGRVRGVEQRPYLVASETEGRIGLQGAEEILRERGMIVRKVPVPYRASWRLWGANADSQIPDRVPGALRVYGDGTAGRRTVTLTLLAGIGATGEARVVVRSDRGRRAITVKPGAPVELAVPVTLPARGSAVLRVRPRGSAGVRLIAVRLAR